MTHSFSGQDECPQWKSGKMGMGCGKFQDMPLKGKCSHLGGITLTQPTGRNILKDPRKCLYCNFGGSDSPAQVVFQWIADPGNFNFWHFVLEQYKLY